MNICNMAIKGKQSPDVSICSCDDDVFSTGCSYSQCIHNKTQEEGTSYWSQSKGRMDMSMKQRSRSVMVRKLHVPSEKKGQYNLSDK